MARRTYSAGASPRKGSFSAFGSRTDVGNIREQNEDSLVVKPPLYVVADGMGGHAAGEVASEIAVSVIEANAPDHPDAEALGHAVEEANRAIINAALAGEGREGMGTTCTAAILEKDRLVLAQVGDSRAYLLHNGTLTQLTRDHSLMADMIESGQITPEEARIHPNRSVITRALGSDPATIPDLYEINVQSGDRLLLCSDGLTSMVPDAQIEAIMNRLPDSQLCASQLVTAAINAGGMDNVTVIVTNVEGLQPVKQRKMARRTKITIVVIIALLLAILGGGIWGGYTYLHNSAYLGSENGKVAIYQGVPGSVLGFSYSELVEVTDIDVSALPPSAAERVKEGLRVENMEEAQDLVKSYRESFIDTTVASHTSSNKKDTEQTDGAASKSADDTATNAASADKDTSSSTGAQEGHTGSSANGAA